MSPKRLLVRAALVPALFAGIAPISFTQETPPAPPNAPNAQNAEAQADEMPTLLSLLRAAPYDANTRGPLLALVTGTFIPTPTGTPLSQQMRRPTLTAVAAALDTHLVSAGSVNVLAPRTMTIINTKPGQANPFGSLSAGESLKLLLSTFSKAQWQTIGSEAGLGQNDLTDDQKPLWSQIMPETAQIQKSTLRTGNKPGELYYEDTTKIVIHPRSTGRLRLNKSTGFSFYKTGEKETSWGGDPYQSSYKDGKTRYDLLGFTAEAAGVLPNSAYGVQLLTPKPSRAKAGAVDFSAPVLDKTISLAAFVRPAPAKTAPIGVPKNAQEYELLKKQAQAERAALPKIADLLAQITKTTGVEFVADRRIRDLPVYVRGESARAGDILSGLALMVSGAFRKMEPGTGKDTAPLYLLTDDIEGIGTRAARLGAWGEAADDVKRRIDDKANDAVAKNDPLSLLGFAATDPFALSKTQTERIETSWRGTKYGGVPDVPAKELSPALRAAVQDFAEARAKQGITIDTSHVELKETLRAYLLVPEMGGKAIESQSIGDGIRGQYLQIIAFDPAKKTPAESAAVAAPITPKTPAKPAPLGFNAPVLAKQRQILMARAETEAVAAQIVQAAKTRGITEVWLEVSEANAASLLTAAIKAGEKSIAVGGVVRLLKNGLATGEPDKNILSETGTAGWVVPGSADTDEMRRRVLEIAKIPRLGGLVFRATGGPGWTGLRQGGDALGINVAQGYTSAMRRVFLRDYGIDPVDIVDMPFQLREIDWGVDYFDAEVDGGNYVVESGELVFQSSKVVPRTAWWAFRQKQNAALLASLWEAVRKAQPLLPLYTDDQVSSYASGNTDWFGSWDTPTGLPHFDPFFGENEMRQQARRTSKTIFVQWGQWWDSNRAAKPNAPSTFAREVSAAARRFPTPAWNGLVIDLSNVPGASVAPLLDGLPKTPARP